MQKVISLQESLIGLGLYDRYYKMYYDVNSGNFGWKLGEEIERFSKLKEALSAFGKLDSVIIIDKSLLFEYINNGIELDALRYVYRFLAPKKNFKVLQVNPKRCLDTQDDIELWDETFSTSLEAKNKIVSLKDKFKEGTKLSILEVKEEYTIQTEVKSFNKLKRI